MKLKAGIIGIGGIAQVAHIPAFQKLDDVEIVAISDINEEKLKFVAEKFNIPKTFTNWEDLLEEDIDIVSICSPNFLHFPQSVKALEKGKNVICEKPLCLSGEEAEKLVETIEKTGKKFMGAFNRRFSGEAIVLKKMIDKGFFGEIYYMKASYLRRRGIPGLGTWFTDKKMAGGGPMLDIGVHMIDFVLFLSGSPMPEVVVGSTYYKFKDRAIDGGWPPLETRKGEKSTGKMDVEDLACGFVKLSNGATLFVEASWAGNSETGLKASLFGTEAGAHLPDPENPENPVRIYSEMDGTLTDIIPQIPKTNPYDDEIKYFVECVKNDAEPITKKNEIIAVARILEGIYKSAETGQPVIYKE